MAELGQRLARLGRAAEDALLVALLGAIVLLAGAQIVVRNTGGGSLIWSDQVLRILVLWVAMFGAVAAARDNNHAVIDLLTHRLGARGKRLAEAVTCAFTSTVCTTIAWHSARFVLEERAAHSLLFGSTPAWPFQCAIPLGLGLIGWRYGVYAVIALRATWRPAGAAG